jgi:hypothetical protein
MSVDREALESVVELVGWESPSRTDVIEQRHVDAFSSAIGRRATSGRIPPTFYASFLTDPPPLPGIEDIECRWLNGGDTFEFEQTVRVGDSLTSCTRLADVTIKDRPQGPIALVTMTTDFFLDIGTVAVRHSGVRVML